VVTIKITDIYDVKFCFLVEMYLPSVDSSASIIRGDQDGTETSVHFCQITWQCVAEECNLRSIILLLYSLLL
jgi:hypothetical protein